MAGGGKSIVVLDIPWLCRDIIGAILSPSAFPGDKVQSKSGLVQRRDLERVFRGKPVGDIVHILIGLELCLPVDVDGLPAYVFPSLLNKSDARPGSVWTRSERLTQYFGKRLCCRTELDMFSPGFMPRFQVSG